MDNKYDFKEINKLHYPLDFDGVHDLSNMFLNRYNKLVEYFYKIVLDCITNNKDAIPVQEKRLQLKDTSAVWGSNMFDNLQTIAKHPGYFTKGSKDYRLYYACLSAYYAIGQYYEYEAQYNKKNADLEREVCKACSILSKQNKLLTYIMIQKRIK